MSNSVISHSIVQTPQRRHWLRVAVGIAVALMIVAAVLVYQRRGIPLVDTCSRWSIDVQFVDSPLHVRAPDPTKRPALSAADVTDVQADFVADPFLIQDGLQWHLFFEVFNVKTQQADIGVASSDDGAKWKYGQIVLDEPFHLSYPYVFRWQDEYYMMPESCRDNCVRLYQAEQFPTRWKRAATLLQGRFSDASIFRHENRWWLFAEDGGQNDTLRLFMADELTGPWKEHPQSPVIQGDGNTARCGGRVIDHDGVLYRFAQDDAPDYGNALRVFRIQELNANNYRESVVPEFLLKGSGQGWNAHGMHHCDAHQLADGKWIVAIDGHRNDLVFGQD